MTLGRFGRCAALSAALLLPVASTSWAQAPGPTRRKPSRPVPLRPPSGQQAEQAPDMEKPELPQFETGIEFKRTPPRERITFNLEDAELTDLVRLISSITGKAFIIPNKTRPVKATVYAPTKVTAAEAYRAFLSILELNGLALVPSGRYLKIVEAQGVEGRTIPLMIDEDVPPEDRFLTHLHRVDFVTAEDVANLLGRFKSPEGNITAYAPTNTLILTDTGNNIRRMLRIVEAIDVERGGEQLWIEPIHHANAADMAQRLTEIFPVETTSGPGKPPPGRPQPARKPGAQPNQPETVGTGGGAFRVNNILADERTNSVILMATEAAYLRILELIRHLDVPLDGDGGIHVHYLQHADAEEVSKTLTTLIGGAAKGRRPVKGQPQPGGDSVFEGEIAITSHQATNSLVVTSSLHDFAALRRVIDRLDSARQQVFIEAVVVNLDINSTQTLGLSYFTGIPDFPTEGSIGVTGFQTSPGALQRSPEGLVAGPLAAGGSDALSGLAMGIQGPTIDGITGVTIPSFGVALAAIASNGDSDVLATPHLLALDNEEAEINIGQNVPLQASVPALGGLGGLGGLGALGALAGGQAGQAGSALGALGGLGGFGAVPRGDVGTRIRLTPHINESDEIRLEIEEEISDVGAAVSGSNVGAVPINRRTAKTQLVVRDQQTVVIGGLMRDAITTSTNKVPFLGDIPLIGALFRKKTSTKSKQNLLLFLTPYIVRTQADLRAIYERKMRERQEFLDRYFVFGTHEYHPTVDYSRTRGLVSEIMLQMREVHTDRELLEKLAEAPVPEHVPRAPVGAASEDALEEALENNATVIEDGENVESESTQPTEEETAPVPPPPPVKAPEP